MIRGNKSKKEKFIRYADVDHLLKRYSELPVSGEYQYDYKLEAMQEKGESEGGKVYVEFSDLPISNSSKLGLAGRNFKKMTEI
jgi:hypothetical protein